MNETPCCPGDWSALADERVPGTNRAAVCALCNTHWNRHDHETPARCYTVTAPSGAWINSHQGGPAGWSLHKALKQAHDREACGLGKHTVEVRTWNAEAREYSRTYDRIEAQAT